ncbi:MAG: aldehyde dehydrogenase family protein, partial [Bacteroidia bacterium]|nr:aldehyde dehydrogenase family protein [Bacteroidia bacterium]
MQPFIWVGGNQIPASQSIPVINPYSNQVLGYCGLATEGDLENAIIQAVYQAKSAKKLSTWQKHDILRRISQKIEEKAELFAKTICLEAGKPITLARIEVKRAVLTFSLAADEVRSERGETLKLDLLSGLEGKKGIVERFPIGPILAISPFNFPLNLVAHKVAPAIATGNSFVLKPASKTPLTALLLAEVLVESGFPYFSVVPCSRKLGQKLVEDSRFQLLSFTGSPEVGWQMKADAGKKKVILE